MFQFQIREKGHRKLVAKSLKSKRKIKMLHTNIEVLFMSRFRRKVIYLRCKETTKRKGIFIIFHRNKQIKKIIHGGRHGAPK